MSKADVNDVIDGYREALTAFVQGDPEPVLRFFSTRADVTLANPLGPPRLGPVDVRSTAVAAAATFGKGGPLRFKEVSSRFEEVSRVVTPDLAYVLQMERVEGSLAAGGDKVVTELRVTMIFRLEDGEWKVVHRHADPITTARSVDTVVQA